jgi:hypothetical protein
MAAIARTNIVAALVLCTGLVLFLSPLANIQRLAVSAHMGRVAAAGGSVEPDWAYLRWESGRFGRQALREMAAGAGVPAGKTWAKQATETLAKTGRYTDGPQTVTAALLADKFAIYPAGKILPASFVQYAQSEKKDWSLKNCLRGVGKCSLWLGDLNGDGQDEVVLFPAPEANTRQAGTLFNFKGDAWSAPGTLVPPENGPLLDPALLQNAQPAPADWRDLVIGGKRFYTNIYR